ncbi:MAG: hypothetical protein P8Z80_05230, partial [Pseudolabrys sp.]
MGSLPSVIQGKFGGSGHGNFDELGKAWCRIFADGARVSQLAQLATRHADRFDLDAMPMTRSRRPLLTIMAGATLPLLNMNAAFAVYTPFGIATPDSSGVAFTGPLGGLFAWVALRQAEFYKLLTTSLEHLKSSGHAFWLLAALSFLYGIFHAVGPGHGKSVITSYLLVTRQTARRGILISFVAGLMQALTAIAVVLVAAVILKATAIGMTQTTDWFLIFSYALVVAVGAWLLWSKATGRG